MVRLYFDVESNSDVPYINTAIFIDKNGNEVVLDRDTTWYNSDEGTVTSMEWDGVYIWDGDEPQYDIPKEFFDGLKFKEFYLDEDASEELIGIQYKCTCLACDYEVFTAEYGYKDEIELYHT